MKPDRLDEVLHAASLIVYCREADCKKQTNFDLGGILGEVDWVTELYRLTHGGELAMAEENVVDPNKRQVGGSHYRLVEYQHWDLVADNGLNYFEGQITKYVARWRKKAGLQDLEKAIHYLDKLVSLYQEDRATFMHVTRGYLHAKTEDAGRPINNLARFVQAYELGPLEIAIVTKTMTYETIAELRSVRRDILTLIASTRLLTDLEVAYLVGPKGPELP